MKLVKDTGQLKKKNMKFLIKKQKKLLEPLFNGLEKILNAKVYYLRQKE